uniref:Methyltransferase domain-containing protein n=1 Tax=Odontella aurita TaxID=265563 RepID=A0A7S4MVX5_9STRA|mmetsp:Transcript_35681/g.106488  ORF Transcript_35681/g.106488 Transcript_35681/m.106488 type:complete len:509 (+) Transcript_35681:283-1809(+)
MLGGWALSTGDNASGGCNTQAVPGHNAANGEEVVLTGRILSTERRGNWEQLIELADTQDHTGGTYRMLLDSRAHEGLLPWATIKGARKLLAPGAEVQAVATAKPSDDGTLFLATKLILVGALPASPFLARLLSFGPDTLAEFFDTEKNTPETTYAALAYALRPAQIAQVRALSEFCAGEAKAGRFETLFKHEELRELGDSIREAQGWTRGPRVPKATSPATWAALERMEQRWCTECADETKFVVGTQTFVSVNTNQDVLLNTLANNLPNPKDSKRLEYICQRKRPQIEWMIGLIRKLLLAHKEENDVFQLVDVGGGRGDLAHAVAKYYGSSVFVTVMDINPTSLSAGRKLAHDHSTANMKFLLCDLSKLDAAVLPAHIDLVFGLHCCGGLSESAVELALRSQASFAVSTCCFRSNNHLASLTSMSTRKASPINGEETEDSTRKDLDAVTGLALIGGAKGHSRAIQAINSMRLQMAKEKSRRSLNTRLEWFPQAYSEQNCVMVGSLCPS